MPPNWCVRPGRASPSTTWPTRPPSARRSWPRMPRRSWNGVPNRGGEPSTHSWMPVQKPEPLYDEDQGPVLIVCATRDRPGDFLRLARSFHDTSIHAHLMAYVDDDQSAAYQALELPPRVRLHVGKRVGPIQAINWIVHSYRSGYRIYGVAPDDATFLTPGWDD